MRILFICPSLQIHSTWLFTLIENLYDGVVCIATNKIDLERIRIPQRSLNPMNARLIRRIDERLNQKFTYPQILGKLEQDYGTSVNYFHFLSFAANYKEFIFKSSRPTIIHCHGKDIMWDLKKFGSGENFHNKQYFKDVKELGEHAFFIANSNFTKSQLLKVGISESKIFINHFGVEVKGRNEKPDNTVFRILYLGRLVDFKGPLETIEAFEKACDLGLNGELIIAGGGELEKRCREKLENSKYKGRIKLLGWVDKDQAEKLYSTSDIFTAHNKKDNFTNQVEAFGVTIIEAMAHGLPVITGKCGGVTDSVVHKETGYLIEPGNIEEHAKILFELYKNKSHREYLGKKAKERVIGYFNPKNEKSRLKKILKQIVQVKGSN